MSQATRDINNVEIDEVIGMLNQNTSHDLAKMEILDVGCGDGRLSYQLSKFAKMVQGIDPVKEDIEKAISINQNQENIKFQVADAQNLPFNDSSFDLVIFSLSLCCMDGVESMKSALREAKRVLKCNGLLLNLQPSMKIHFLSGFQWYLVTGDMDDLTLWSSQESRFALKLVSLDEQLFQYISESNFTTQWFHKSKKEAIASWVEKYQDEFDKLNSDVKNKINQYVDQFVEENGVIYPVEETLTLLKKDDNC